MFKSTDLYIDLGTANTLVYARGRGFILNEPSVLAVKKNSYNSTKLFALGKTAKRMLGKNPENLFVLRPLREGVIADFESTSIMLSSFIKQAMSQVLLLRPRLIISLPCQVTHYEKRSVEEIGLSLGAHKVHLLHEPVAAAIGANLPILENRGSMVVDIGGGTTEIAVISMGGIVTAHAVRIGGNNIDNAIINTLQHDYRFAIGEQTAEFLKIAIGSAIPVDKSVEIGGIDLTCGLPKHRLVSSQMIYPAINTVVVEIIASIRKALEECPPEISGDIALHGIMLAGGGALIHGVAKRISNEVGIPVHIADKPLLSVAIGGAKALENDKLFEALEHPA